jgi:TolB protein
MSKVFRILAAAAIAAVVVFGFSPETTAQSTSIDGLTIQISKPGGRDLPLAIPRPSGGDPEADTLWALITRDMEISGYFRVLDSRSFIEPVSAGLEPGQFRYTDWDVPGATALAKTSLSRTSSGQYRAEVWVYDVPGRERLGARAFTAEASQLRTLGHRISNQIIEYVGGEGGIFNTRFAAVSNRSGNKEIVLVDIDGARVVPVTRNGAINIQPAWGADARSLAFTSYRRGNPDLYIADLSRGRTRPISAREGINAGASFSPLGSILALTMSTGGNSDIFTIDIATGDSNRLTRTAGLDLSPTWSPDGTKIAFASERSGGVQIYQMDARGGSPERVTFNGNHNTDPAWSPNGDRIAYVSRNGHYDVYTVGLNGSGRIRITENQGNNEDPSWSPDGRYIAFTSNRSGGSHIWVSTSDNVHQVQITEGRGTFSNPSWSPALW